MLIPDSEGGIVIGKSEVLAQPNVCYDVTS